MNENKGNRVYVVKLHIEVKEEYLDVQGIEDAIRENIMYPSILPDSIAKKEIVSWWRYYKGKKNENKSNSISE